MIRMFFPLRISIPLSLAALGTILMAIDVTHNRYTSFRNVESTIQNRTIPVSYLLTTELEQDLIHDDIPSAEDKISRVSLIPDLSLALVSDDSDRVILPTNFALKSRSLNTLLDPSSRRLIERAR